MALNRQLDICRKYGAAYSPPALDSRIGIALNVKLGLIPLNGLRHPPENSMNGWYIWAGPQSNDPDFYQSLCVEHIGDHCPIVSPFLALPPGWAFITDGSYVDVWFDPKLLVP